MFDAEGIITYLQSRGLVPAHGRVTATAMGGGISNSVFRIETSEGERFLTKQAREKLDVSADWRIDRARALNEARCLDYLEKVLPAGTSPHLLFADEQECLIGMTLAPAGGEIWKRQLLTGRIDPDTARLVGSALALIHSVSAADPAVPRAFDVPDLFEQGRIDPYFRTAASRHSDLAPMIRAEIARLTSARRALVLGDVSPKNICVYPTYVYIFDVEVAHWGDPAFDVAFCLSHLLLKALVFETNRERLLSVARDLWDSYSDAIPDWPAYERDVIAELGCLLLARVDGKSPVEYLQDEQHRNTIRRVARSVLLEPPSTVRTLLGELQDGARIHKALV